MVCGAHQYTWSMCVCTCVYIEHTVVNSCMCIFAQVVRAICEQCAVLHSQCQSRSGTLTSLATFVCHRLLEITLCG